VSPPVFDIIDHSLELPTVDRWIRACPYLCSVAKPL